MSNNASPTDAVALTPVTELAARHTRPARRADRGLPAKSPRRDIQALRALAVGAVVFNHLWPHRVSGGYVGVDVFFVISGFLITSHLAKELRATGRIKLGVFYARRALRLLPAAFLVIVTSMVAVRFLLPYSQWAENAKQLFASSVYVENWVLAARSVNYSAQTAAATVAQHYWSLSVEEQFYLVWPVLLIAATLLGRRLAPRRATRVVVAVLGTVGVASLLYCVWITRHDPSPAYFVTPARVWEFSLGGILAVLAPHQALRRAVAEPLAWVGWVAIVATCFLYGTHTSFPGVAALVPTLGAAAVILAGSGRARLSHERVTGMRPVQFLGDTSYAIYLWHWPLVIVMPFALGHALSFVDKAAVVVTAVVLAAFTKYFVEDPGRRWRWATARSYRVLLTMLGGIAVIGALAFAIVTQAHSHEEQAVEDARLATSAECAGPRSLDDPACPDPYDTPPVNATVSEANNPLTISPECGESTDALQGSEPGTTVCDFSGGKPDAPTAWLIGDSHAVQWQSALVEIAKQRHWRLTISTVPGCPFADVTYVAYENGQVSPGLSDRCMQWKSASLDELLDQRPDMVFTSSYTRGEEANDGSGRSQLEQFTEGFSAYWTRLIDAGVHVYPIADIPLNDGVRDPNCVLLNQTNPRACAVSREVAQPTDPLVAAAAKTPGTTLIDLTSRFCDEKSCYAVVGGIPIYWDANHINKDYVQLLIPDIEKFLA